jgi:protein SCO1/2
MKMHAVRPVVREVTAGIALAVCLGVSLLAQPAEPLSIPTGPAATEQVPILKTVGVDQKLDNTVPFDATFVDENGHDVKLGTYFGTRPVILVLAYYRCPMLCGEIQNALASSLEALTFKPGKDFNVVVVSFDPGDTPAMAAEKRNVFIKRYDRPGTEDGIHFLTGRKAEIDALTNAVGFKYAYDPAIDQFAHPALITILTSDGHVSRYLFGIEFAPRDVKLALVEATGNRIGTATDQLLLYCYHYDPSTGKYGIAVMNVVRLGGALTLGGLGAFVFLSLRRERRRKRTVRPTATGTR